MNYIELNNQTKIKDENGLYQFDKDKEAVRRYFLDEVNERMVWHHDLEERLEYMVENNYYNSKILNKYSFNNIKKLTKQVYGEKFRFESFMSAFKFYNNYTLRTDDRSRFLERYEDRIVMNALHLADGNFKRAQGLADVMIKQCLQPATPTFMNAGRARSGELVSCFLLDTMDSTEGIEYIKYAIAQLSRRGGGVSANLSKIRAQGEEIKGVDNSSSGIIGVAKMIESTVEYYDQLG